MYTSQVLVALQGIGCAYELQLFLQGVSWEGHIKFSCCFFFPFCSCLLKLKGDAAKFKPRCSRTKRDVRANLVRSCILAQRGSEWVLYSNNFLCSGRVLFSLWCYESLFKPNESSVKNKCAVLNYYLTETNF